MKLETLWRFYTDKRVDDRSVGDKKFTLEWFRVSMFKIVGRIGSNYREKSVKIFSGGNLTVLIQELLGLGS